MVEPLTAACVLAIAAVAWLVLRGRRRFLRRRLSANNLELGEKRRRHGAASDGSGPAEPSSISAPRFRSWSRLAARRLCQLLDRLRWSSPHLARSSRAWLSAEPKRRDSNFTGPPQPQAAPPQQSTSARRASVRAGVAREQAVVVEVCPKLLGSTSDSPSVLNRAQLAQLARALPARLAILDWSLVYSTDQHGCSLGTFYARAARCGPSLLLVLDSGGFIFGAFCTCAWHKSDHYFGTGEAFLVRVQPEFAVHRWTRKNSLFALGGADHIAVGGGGGFGLYLDGSFENGSSAPSETFDNEPLGSSRDFRCVKLELWTFT
jgi:hypothetical protein